MDVEKFVSILKADFFVGVPDSQLKSFCNYLMKKYGTNPKHHIIAANEGNAVAIAAGYCLSTGKVPVVYLQNSGEGNIVNPVASLLNDKVYAIPAIFVIGWRGEPGIHDEPQHIFQGEITLTLLDILNIKYFVVNPGTSSEEIESVMKDFQSQLTDGKSVAFVIRKKALSYSQNIEYKNDNKMSREEAIHHIITISGDAPIVSTTGKASRELFELRENIDKNHNRDFLTVGSMGHASSIALGIAINNPDKKIWCIDGDGAAIMHMGAMAVIASTGIKNLIHVVINNGSHESVGGFPTAAGKINLSAVAKDCGYSRIACVDNLESLDTELNSMKNYEGSCFLEIKCSIGARNDLGRPTTSTYDNKENFMRYLTCPI